ncbi:hypothetical protein PS914_04126 [Pseudomonas fluorescens]|nr:hypothetical protein PS914_04126 [Pseudomonas fluorescens]
MLAKAVCLSLRMLNLPPPSRAGSLPQGIVGIWEIRACHRANVGASLLAKAVCLSLRMLNLPPPSRAGSLPQGIVGIWEIRA